MKITYSLFFTSVVLILNGCSNKNINPTPYGENSQNYIKQNEFEKGYASAIKKEKLKWEKRGYQRALAIVKKYSADIRSYEAGKYAIKNKFVTYPKLIALQSNGSIKLKSLGCEIRNDMTVEDIFHYYNKNRDKIPNNSELLNTHNKSSSQRGFSEPPFSQGFSSAPKKIQQTMSLPNERKIQRENFIANDAENKRVILALRKTYKSKDVIDKFSLNCKEGNSSYSCEFLSQIEKDLFCRETKICHQ